MTGELPDDPLAAARLASQTALAMLSPIPILPIPALKVEQGTRENKNAWAPRDDADGDHHRQPWRILVMGFTDSAKTTAVVQMASGTVRNSESLDDYVVITGRDDTFNITEGDHIWLEVVFVDGNISTVERKHGVPASNGWTAFPNEYEAISSTSNKWFHHIAFVRAPLRGKGFTPQDIDGTPDSGYYPKIDADFCIYQCENHHLVKEIRLTTITGSGYSGSANAAGFKLVCGAGANYHLDTFRHGTISNNTNNQQGVTMNLSSALTLSGTLSGANPINVTGTGTLTLSGTNTYSGALTISPSATVSVGAAANLGTASVIFNGGTFKVTGTSLASLSAFTRSFTSGRNFRVNIFDAAHTYTEAQALTHGSGGVVKLGAGTLVLSGTNTFTGTVTMSEGTLSVAASSNLGGTNSIVFDGGTFKVTGTSLTSFGVHTPSFTSGNTVTVDVASSGNTFTISQTLNQGSGGFTKLGAGTVVLSGTNTFTGAVTLTAGTLSVAADANLGGTNNLVFNGGTLTITGTAFTGFGLHTVVCVATKAVVLDIAAAGNTFSTSAIFNQTTGTFTKSGAGTLVLSGASTYTGATSITAGTLKLTNSGSLTSGSIFVSGTLVVDGLVYNGFTASTVTVNNGGTLKSTCGVAPGAVQHLTVDAGGTFFPGGIQQGGAYTNTFTVAGNLNIAGALTVRLNSNTPEISTTDVGGDLNITSGATLTVTDDGSTALISGTAAAIINYTGTWNGVAFSGKPAGSTLTIGPNTYTLSYSGGTVKLTVV